MKPDTPLTEVAALIPVDAANILTAYAYEVQESTLRMTRSAIIGLEDYNVVLDPVQAEAVLNVIVVSLAPLADALYRIGRENR